jgi:hypothetical protein
MTTVTPVASDAPVAPVAPKKNYINNKDLLIHVSLSKSKGRMSDTLALMLQTLTKRYAKKGNFANYSYNEDMQAYAMLMLCKTWASFDENKSNNPFAFFTQCIKNSFIQYLNQERRVRDIKNMSLIDNGFNPSYSYILEHESEYHDRREANLNSDADIVVECPIASPNDFEIEIPEDIITETPVAN